MSSVSQSRVVAIVLPTYTTLQTSGMDASLQKIALAAIHYYEQLIPLVVSLFADSELIERHRRWMQEQNSGPQRIFERVTTFIEAEQQQGRIADSLDAFSVSSLLLGPYFQFAFLRYFIGGEPFQLTGSQFVVDMVSMLTKGLEQS